MSEQELVNIYAFTDANIESIISELQELKEGKRKYTGFTGSAGSVLIVSEDTFSLLEAGGLNTFIWRS